MSDRGLEMNGECKEQLGAGQTDGVTALMPMWVRLALQPSSKRAEEAVGSRGMPVDWSLLKGLDARTPGPTHKGSPSSKCIRSLLSHPGAYRKRKTTVTLKL